MRHTEFKFEPIGTVRSGFKEKFGIPRQSRLAKSARAEIRLPLSKFRDALDGLEDFSHLWVLFVFHQAMTAKLRVRPPRLGGAKKLGVFATRSPHRPNPIGMSVVELERIERTTSKDLKEIVIHVRGADLLDGTPVLDIKPYIPYADSIPRARAAWADLPGKKLRVRFAPEARQQCHAADPQGTRGLKRLISEVLSLDPRPAFQRKKGEEASYAFRLEEFDVHWAIRGTDVQVTELKSS
jgi:tRNA-Thr(GGU) m(6)t(6)A37 methyltransferase TsaA